MAYVTIDLETSELAPYVEAEAHYRNLIDTGASVEDVDRAGRALDREARALALRVTVAVRQEQRNPSDRSIQVIMSSLPTTPRP